MFHPTYFVGCNYAKIIESSDYVGGVSQSSGYPASNVLVDMCEDKNNAHNIDSAPSGVSWWVAVNGGTDTEAEFVLELGCEKIVDRIVLKNMANGIDEDRWVWISLCPS